VEWPAVVDGMDGATGAAASYAGVRMRRLILFRPTYLVDVFTVTCNIAGIPGISIPAGFTAGATPTPLGIQLLGPTFSEEKHKRSAGRRFSTARGGSIFPAAPRSFVKSADSARCRNGMPIAFTVIRGGQCRQPVAGVSERGT